MKRFFYKFMPLNDYTLENISKNQIWFSCPLDFNDPFDFLIPFDYTFSDKKFREKVPHIPNYSKDQYEDMVKLYKNNPIKLKKWSDIGIKRFVSKMRVACFCEEKKEILMWSHYADFHKGICLKFDSNKDRYFFYEEDWNIHKMEIGKVYYPKNFEKINILENDPKVFEKQAFTKYHKWKYEKEHRIISTVDAIQYNKNCLVEVNFGCKLKPTDDCVKNAIKHVKSHNYQNVKFIQAMKPKDRFGLSFEEIE